MNINLLWTILIILVIVLGYVYILKETYATHKNLIKLEYNRRMKIWRKRIGGK